VTKRAKIAAEHRDAKNPVNADPDKPSTGKKRSGKNKPWVVECKIPKNASRKVFWFEKHDGEWHIFGRFVSQKAAEQAMANYIKQRRNTSDLVFDPKTHIGKFIRVTPQWRIRDTRIKEEDKTE
jgi:hypothetical protein